MRSRVEYPSITAFVRGYLHQDAREEYGSPRSAAQQFCKDADRTQVEELRREWQRFRARHGNIDEINNALQQLGCAWQFNSSDEFDQMLDVVLSQNKGG